MRKDQHDDLATALPPSLTVELHLPEPVYAAPDDPDMVALDAVAAPSAAEPVAATRSIEIVTAIVTVPAVVEAEPEPVIAPLPAAPEAVVEAAPRPKPVRAVASGRRPAPEGTWPALVYGATLHLVNIGDSGKVRARKALDARIARRFAEGPRFVPLLSRKGGVGTTTITTLLGMALAEVRDDRVLAIDANPDRGTLADRVPRQTESSVRDVLLHAPELRAFDDVAALVSHDSTGLDVAASDTDPQNASPFDDGGYNVVAEVVSPHYGVVVTDGGAGVVHPATRASLQRADAVVVVSGGGLDEARLASETLTWLEANDYADLAANAVVALNASTQGTDLEKLDEIEEHFLSRVRSVVRFPYDPELAAGSIVRFGALRPFTRDSARELAALVVDGLPAERA